MDDNNMFYLTPNAMEPLFPSDDSGELEQLAIELISKSAQLSGMVHPITRKAIADFLRPMNSYYSNLIEGHDTHPIDIARALKKDYSEDKEKRNLQFEAQAHIKLKMELENELSLNSNEINVTSIPFIKSIHKRFYEHLPEEFKQITNKEGVVKFLEAGEFRTDEVEVGRHVGPYSKNLNLFMERFEAFYNPKALTNKSKIHRVIAIAASHHRLAWIHPFLDGNGRVVRLYSDAYFISEGLDSSGLWSISRGLARTNTDYKSKLANADLKRFNNYDGRGNLSNKMLIEFCVYFLKTAIDQIDYMSKILDISEMLERIHRFSDLMVFKNIFKPQAKIILENVFLKGKITKSEALKITNLSDKTLKLITDKLIEVELIQSVKEGIHSVYYANYPVHFSPYLFPGIYPSDKEIEFLRL